ncbi:MAG: hypothetical protein IKX57_00920 [Oscillospiraceae bacterium]|nr:hypothetical protein [Oscillospiraceae bacterium]
MKQRKNGSSGAHAIRQPLPDAEIQRNAPHGKTADDLPEQGDLPVKILAKEIPATDVHDM